MSHSHPAGWAPIEIGIYIDSILKNGIPLPRVGPMKISPAGTVTIEFTSETKITESTLCFTTDTGLRSKRKWQASPRWSWTVKRLPLACPTTQTLT